MRSLEIKRKWLCFECSFCVADLIHEQISNTSDVLVFCQLQVLWGQ